MKRFISILLILITALYVLPVSDGLISHAETTCKCIDKATDDGKDIKKEKGKEFIQTDPIVASLRNGISTVPVLPFVSAIPVHFTLEAPPPDKA